MRSLATPERPSEGQLVLPSTDALLKSIGIPSRPSTLVHLQSEMDQADPDIRRIADLVASDVALTIATLRIVNSPAFALSRRCETVEQAIAMLGLKQLNVIVTGLALRNLIRGDAGQLRQFFFGTLPANALMP